MGRGPNRWRKGREDGDGKATANTNAKVTTGAAAEPAPIVQEKESSWWSSWSWSDIGHVALDVAGMIPVVGNAADLANAAWYTAEGNYTDAALSAAAAVPGAGQAVIAAKYAKKGAAAATKAVKAADKAADAAKAADKAKDAKKAKEAADAAKKGKNGEGVPGKKKPEKKNNKPCKKKPKKPVLMPYGIKMYEDASFVIPGVLPLVISSLYHGNSEASGPFGNRRVSEADATITRNKEGGFTFVDDDNDPVNFKALTPNPGHWEEGDNVRHMLLQLGPKRRLILKEGGEFRHFDKGSDGNWRISEVRDRNDNALIYSRRADGLLEKITTPEGLSAVFTYEARGLRTKAELVSRDGERKTVLTWAYDEAGNMIASESSFGETYRFTYDENNHLTSAQTNGAHTARYAYDDQSRVTGYSTDYYYHGSRFTYDDEKRITTYFPAGDEKALEKFYYNENKNILLEANAIGALKRTIENDEGYVAKEIDGEGCETSYTYDVDGNIKSITDGEGRETFYYWDEDGQLEILIDPEGNSWDYEYDDKSNLEAVQDPLGHRTEIKNNEAGLPLAVCRHDGHIQFNTYDDYHRLIETVDFGGAKTRFERDPFGRITTITDPTGEVTRFVYADQTGVDFWEPSEIIRSDGAKQVIKAAGDRKTTETLDGEGRKTVSEVDAYGNLTAMTDAGGGRLAFHYDKLEQLEKVENQQGLFWTFERDGAQRITKETDFSGQVTTYAYDYADRLIESRQNKVKRRYEWDKSGLLLKQKVFVPGQAEPEVTSYWYDDRGLLAGAENAAAKVEFERDAAGQIIAEITGGVRIESEYDCCGRRILRRLDGSETTYNYFPTDGLKELTIAGHAPLTFTRDARGLELGRSSAAGFQLEQSFDALGQLARQRAGRKQAAGAPGVERNYGWNRAFEPTKISDKRWGGLGYGYDKNGQIIETRFGDGAAEKFAYDKALNVAATAHATATSQSDGASTEGTTKQQPVYTMKIRPNEGHSKGPDAADFRTWQSAKGGRIEEARGANGETIRLKFDEHSRVTERRVTRKGFREQVWRYGWDGEDRLVECFTPRGQRYTYAYDPFGRRVEKQTWVSAVGRQSAADPEFEPGQKTRYLWDGDVLARETVLGAKGETLRASNWHFEPESFVPIAKQEGEQLWYVVTDHLGTPRELLSEDGTLTWAAEYGTWGSIRRLWQADNDNEDPSRGELQGYDLDGKPVYATRFQTSGNLALKPLDNPDPLFCPIRFQGQWADEETGLYYNRFRHYDPLSAQYMSPDPIGIDGGMRSQGYVSLPGSWVDPLGLSCSPGPFAPDRARSKGGRKTDQVFENRRCIKKNKLAIERLKFLGPNHFKVGPGKWRSADCTRQFRIKPNDYFGHGKSGPHAHFEFLKPNPSGSGYDVIKNIHVPIR